MSRVTLSYIEQHLSVLFYIKKVSHLLQLSFVETCIALCLATARLSVCICTNAQDIPDIPDKPIPTNKVHLGALTLGDLL